MRGRVPMALSLAAVLAHPAVLQCRPVVLAGDPAARTVRWVHSSEIYEIAPLLRGGELLLTTGLGLAGCTAEERRAYVRALAARDVAGLALELAGSLPEPPEDMVAEAERLGLPFVALQRRYPFVEVTEQVNSAILDSSIVRLRHADDVGRALSRVLAERGGLDRLTTTLATLLERAVVLTDATGSVLSAAAEDPDAVLRAPSARATVAVDGLLLGSLAIGDGDTEDDLLRAAVDRAPEIFAIEVLREGQQPLLSGRARRDLLERLLTGASEDADTLTAHASDSHISPSARWAGLAVDAVSEHAGLALVQEIGRVTGVQALSAEIGDVTYALVALPDGSSKESLLRIAASLKHTRGPNAALGPVVAASAAGRSLRAARQTLALGRLGPERVMVAEDLALERLLSAVTDTACLGDLVEEQLGGLLRSANGEDLLATLEHYLTSGGSKAATARALHLRRQSVHQRLHRISDRLGYDVTDPRRQPALWLALLARRTVAAGPARD